jgi:hypothetical protein
VAKPADLQRGALWAIPLKFLLRRSGTALVLGLFFLPEWGFWRVAAVALVIQLPPNLLFHDVSSAVPSEFFVNDEIREKPDQHHRHVEAVVAEIAARAGVKPPAVWLTRSIPKTAGAGIFERRLRINPGVYSALSKPARRALIAHELAHQYDQASRERLVADLAIFIPAGIADAAIVLTLHPRRERLDACPLSRVIEAAPRSKEARLARETAEDSPELAETAARVGEAQDPTTSSARVPSDQRPHSPDPGARLHLRARRSRPLAGGLSVRTEQNCAHGRRPPALAAVGRWYVLGCQ